MDDEKLIEYVRECEEIYNLFHPQYLNGTLKDKKWSEISNKLEQVFAACKARWNNIRDNFRKSMKKRVTKSGQAAPKNKKYKYEDQLSFLLPFMKERDTLSNLDNVEKNPGDESDHSENDTEEIDVFLTGLAPTLKSLTPYYLNIAKSRIFNIIQEIEINQIMHQQQQYTFTPDSLSTPVSSPSPNTIPCPTISPTINSVHAWPSPNNNDSNTQQTDASFTLQQQYPSTYFKL
ncbi:uncharacterized protein [Anoplolepis gracilipes]|uniref:uncharacterized protein n=1 Tax=Anoplolepis gracilipes TaxID=354296 RepID=UPI003BA1B79D